MRKFALEATIKRVVIDTVSLHVEADNEDEAYEKARQTLSVFPDPVDVDGIPYCYIENRENCEAEIINIKEEEDRGVA